MRGSVSYLRHHPSFLTGPGSARICPEPPVWRGFRGGPVPGFARIRAHLPGPIPHGFPIRCRPMASIQRNGARWRVQLYVQGVRDSASFATRQEAAQWALQREAELTGKRLPDRTLADAMAKYAREVAPTHKGARWEAVRLKALGEHPIASRKLAGLAGSDFAAWRDKRLQAVKPGTVARELTLLRSVLESCRRDWQWIRENPLTDVRWPKTPPGRARRISPSEVEAMARALGVWDSLPAETATQRVGLAFLFALETAMRAGEIMALRRADVFLGSRYLVLPRTKNGDRREVPLTSRAVEILKALPEGEGPMFGLVDSQRDALWRKARPAALADLHFHDTRSEAIWRLSKKLDVLQLARMIGHRDPKSLMHYYNESAADMALRLG
jgi:integrase